MTTVAVDSNLAHIPMKVLPGISPFIERITHTTRYEKAPARTRGVARGARGIRVRAVMYDEDDFVALQDLFDETETEPIHFDCRQAPIYTGDYILGDLEPEDETQASSRFTLSFTLYEAPPGDIMASLFDTNAARTRPIIEAPVRWQAGSATPAASIRGTLITGTASAQEMKAIFAADSDASTNPTADTTALATGDKVEWVGYITPTSYLDLSANNLMGIRLGDATVDFTKTATARNQIIVGVDSTGAIFLVNANTSAVTSTNTGATVASGTRVKFRITFIVGTSVSVTINNQTTTTNTTNLPTVINTMHAGWGAAATTNTKTVLSQSATWRWQAAS